MTYFHLIAKSDIKYSDMIIVKNFQGFGEFAIRIVTDMDGHSIFIINDTIVKDIIEKPINFYIGFKNES